MKKCYSFLFIMLFIPFTAYSHYSNDAFFLLSSLFSHKSHRSYSWCTWLSDCFFWNGTACNVRHELANEKFDGNTVRFANALQECVRHHNYKCFAEIVTACKSQGIPFDKDVVAEKLNLMKDQRADEILLLAQSLKLVLDINSNPAMVPIRPTSGDQFLAGHSEHFGRLRANKKATVVVARLIEHDLGDESDEESYSKDRNIGLKIKTQCADQESEQVVDEFFSAPHAKTN